MDFKEIVITNGGKKCLDEILKNRDLDKDRYKKAGFDIIILDTHLRDIPFVEVATKSLCEDSCCSVSNTCTSKMQHSYIVFYIFLPSYQ